MQEHLKTVEEIKPDIYAISFTTPKRDLSFETIKKVKALGLKMLMVAGGAHPTIDPQDVLKTPRSRSASVAKAKKLPLN